MQALPKIYCVNILTVEHLIPVRRFLYVINLSWWKNEFIPLSFDESMNLERHELCECITRTFEDCCFNRLFLKFFFRRHRCHWHAVFGGISYQVAKNSLYTYSSIFVKVALIKSSSKKRVSVFDRQNVVRSLERSHARDLWTLFALEWSGICLVIYRV